jgi:hypothetical protein
MFDERTRDLGGAQRRSDGGVRELGSGEHIGDWLVQRTLGGGGFGTVYEVRHSRTQQRAALKLLHAHFLTSPEMLARFDREIEVLRRLRHPNIVNLVEAGFSKEDRPDLCMDLVEGEELSKLIERTGRLSPHQALAVFEPLCEALSAAHELNIIHRDIKASNVLVSAGEHGAIDRVMLLDFGIAKLSDALAPELTASRQSLGTPSCMAPEQIHGLRVDGRTDVYALGGLLFHMLTGRLPFQDSSATMTQYLHLHARRPTASSMVPVSRRLDDVIARAMAIEPENRFDHPRSLLAAAHAALRESTMMPAQGGEVPCIAILVAASDRMGSAALDAALLDDLEGVLPAAERILIAQGFQIAVDLGSSALFVARAEQVPDPISLADSLYEQLARRPRRHPRVKVSVAVHRDDASYVGIELQPCSLLRPASWNIPEAIEGLWVTGKLDATAPTGRCVRS